MKKIPFLYFLFLLVSGLAYSQVPLTRDADVPVPVVNSRAAVVMDAATGTLLYFKNPDEEIPPASLTKLMTIHLALTEV